jgi:hypothetical protein
VYYVIEQFSVYEAIKNIQRVHQNVNGGIVKDQTKTSVYYVIEQYVIHHIKYIINSPIKEYNEPYIDFLLISDSANLSRAKEL